MNPQKFFTQAEKQQIEHAIIEAEKLTSGEIRLHIDRTSKGDVLDCAWIVFGRLKMHETNLRNGVLFYLSIDDKKFAIIGDEGIHAKVPKDFWNCIYKTIIVYFRNNKFAEGLCWAIQEAGKQLSTHFPCSGCDVNELSNDISFE